MKGCFFVVKIEAMKDTKVQTFEGVVVQALPNTTFRVKLSNGEMVLGVVAGKMRRYFIRILPGDRVRIEMTLYDKNRGRIVWREK